MMTNIPWADILPAAVAVTLSPVPIMAVILALFGQHPRQNGLSFLVGWVAGLAALAVLLLFFVDLGKMQFTANWTPVVATVKLWLGLFFFVLAAVQWRRRPRAGEAQPLPAWTARLENFSPGQTLLVAIGLCVINPKNLTLTLAILLALGEADLPAWQAVLGLAVFVVLGSLTIAVPVFYRIVAGAEADSRLARSKVWLQEHSSTVMVVVFLLLGALLFGRGLEGIM